MAFDDDHAKEAQEDWRQAVELRKLFGQACDGKSSSAVGRALSLMVADVIWQNSGDVRDSRRGLEVFARDVERAIASKGQSQRLKMQ